MKHRQLFLDDYIVERIQGVRRVVNQPERHPANPVLVADRKWEMDRTEVSGSPQVVFDEREQVFRMYYIICLWLDQPDPYRCCYAESRDGIHWEKPVVGTSVYDGSHDNNLIGYQESVWVRRPSIVIDDRDPDPNRRYKMLYVTLLRDKPPRQTTGRLACSADGKHWRFDQGKSIRFGAPGQTVLGFVPEIGRWVMYPRPLMPHLSMRSMLLGLYDTARAGLAAGRDAALGTRSGFYDHRGVRTIYRSESSNRLDWSRPVEVLKPDA